MKIKRLTSDGKLKPLAATPIVHGDKLYYNVFHGDPKCWEFRCAVDLRLSTVKKDIPYVFKDDHYLLKEIKNKVGDITTDKNGNIYYVISKQQSLEHKFDLLLFWTIDPTLKNVDYSITGNHKVIGQGCNGAKDNKIPSPVIALYDDCILSYHGINEDGKKVMVSYRYKYDDAVIAIIKKV